MNTKNTLPTELVEKMAIHVILARDYVRPTVDCVNECAKIAVQYADEVSLKSKRGASKWLGKYNELDREFQVIKHQRDELLEALRESQLQLEYLSKKFGETGSGNSIISRNNVIIKTHEDGKE